MVAHQLHLDPLLLLLRQQVVLVDLFLFLVEGLDDDTDKQVEEEQIDQDFDKDAEDDEERLVQHAGLHVFVRRVHLAPHVIDPALSRLKTEQRKHATQRRVEVKVGVHPFSSVVNAVPLGLDEDLLLLVRQRNVVVAAGPKLAREEGRVQNSEEEQEENDDELQVSNGWQRFE